MKPLLGIDTSCDDTSVAFLDPRDGRVLASLVSSQTAVHAPFGGVVPELASRSHSENLPGLFAEALRRAGLGLADLGGVAVTHTPGLMGCLLVGTSFAKALALRLKIPLYAINHLEAHLFSPFIGAEPLFPFLGLVVSGGHTAFYRADSFGKISLLGQTVDDAAGEAFDKSAKLMGLGYPGGPLIDRLARGGDASRFAFTSPKVKLGPEYLSFSGVKTAVFRHVETLGNLDETARRDLSASLEAAVVRMLIGKAADFLGRGEYAAFALSGGVALNTLLRERVASLCAEKNVACAIARPEHCADNAAMVAYLAAHRDPEGVPLDVNTAPSRKMQVREELSAKRRLTRGKIGRPA